MQTSATPRSAASPGGLERRAWSGIVAGGAAFGAVALQNVAVVPLLLAHWKAEEYALWVSLLAAQSLLQSVDVGHQTFVGNELTRAAHESAAEFGRILGSAFGVSVVLGLLQLLALGTILLTAGPEWLVGMNVGQFHGVALALWVLLGAWALTWPVGGVLVKTYAGLGRYARSAWWFVAMRTVQATAVVIAVARGGGFLAAAIAYSATWLVIGFANIIDAVALLRRAGLWQPRLDLRLGFRNATRSLVVCGTSMLDQAGASGVLLLVGRGLGLAALAPFTTLRTLANTAIQAANLLLQPLVPEFIRLRAERRPAAVAAALTVSEILCGGVVNLGLLISLPVAPWVFARWTRGQVGFDAPLYCLLALSVALRSAGTPATSYLLGTNALGFQGAAAVVRNGAALLGAIVASATGSILALGGLLAAGELAASIVLPLVHLRREQPGAGAAWRLSDHGDHGVVIVTLVVAMLWPAHLALVAATGAGLLALALWLRWRRIDPGLRARVLSGGKGATS